MRDLPLGFPTVAAAIDAQVPVLRRLGQNDVGDEREIEEQSLARALFRHEAQTRGGRISGGPNVDAPAVDFDMT